MTDPDRNQAPDDFDADDRNKRRARVLIPAGILVVAALLILFMVLVSQLGR
ncbi:hypothetical protein [Blastococcus sp. TF02A-35]|uniref:hypothetical protein n=1 Tax=Blastococcus sp. TF02A-35 TaxID=2559612 RepID=UPI00142F994B|nr:hypothetical protein [Blastococcus sp. TF02A_35]